MKNLKISYLPEELSSLVVRGKWGKREFGWDLTIKEKITKADWKEIQALCAAFGGSAEKDYRWKFPYCAETDLELACSIGYIKNVFHNYCYLPMDLGYEMIQFAARNQGYLTYLIAYPGYCKLMENMPGAEMIYFCNETIFPEPADNWANSHDNISVEFLEKEIGTFNLQVDCVICRAPITKYRDIEIFNAGLKHLKPNGTICVLGGNDWFEKNHKLDARIESAYTSYSMIPAYLFTKDNKRKDVCLWKYQKVK